MALRSPGRRDRGAITPESTTTVKICQYATIKTFMNGAGKSTMALIRVWTAWSVWIDWFVWIAWAACSADPLTL